MLSSPAPSGHRLRIAALLAVAALTIFGGAAAFAATPRQGDGCFEECGPTGPTLNTMSDENMGMYSMPFDDVYKRGIPFQCGSPADKSRGLPEVACHIEAKVTVPAKVASFLHLSSRVIAHGVAKTKVDHLKNDYNRDQGRLYFLPLPSKVKAALRAKRIGAMGVKIAGTVSEPGAPAVYCESDSLSMNPPKHASCSFSSGKKALTYGGQDGEMLCWRYMPWWLATPSPGWGKMCPRPVTTH